MVCSFPVLSKGGVEERLACEVHVSVIIEMVELHRDMLMFARADTHVLCDFDWSLEVT